VSDNKMNEHEQQNYACAIHESGHTVAAYALGFGMRNKGMVLRNSRVKGFVDGVAYTGNPAIHWQNPTRREFFLKGRIVISFAGPVAQNMVGEVVIDQDVMSIAWALRKLLPMKRRFLRKLLTSILHDGDYSGDFYILISTLVTSTYLDRQKALEAVNDYTDADEDADEGGAKMETNARLFEILWPLAQEAQSIIDHRWSSVETLACDLVKTRRLGREEIEKRLPWAGDIGLQPSGWRRVSRGVLQRKVNFVC
jgi:hypothetical protein